jgi:Zn-dependent protease with chaperone function
MRPATRWPACWGSSSGSDLSADGDAAPAPEAWRGQYMDGLTAAVTDVRLAAEGEALIGRTPGGGGDGDGDGDGGGDGSGGGAGGGGEPLFRWPLARLRVEPLGDGRVSISCADAPDAALTTAAHDAAANLALPGAMRPARSRLRAILAYGGGALAVAALVYVNLDPLARAIARRVPPSYEAELGLGLADLLERQYCETEEARRALATLARRIGVAAPPPMHVLDADIINAFTFPGGVVVVTRGLLAEAAGPDELAGIVAHEIEHVQQRHVMIHVVRSGILTAAWQATLGDYAGLFVVDPKTAFDIASLRFSRDDEREADRGAIARLDAAGISRVPFRRFFERMRAKTDAIPPWLTNHPASAERIAAIGDDGGAVQRTPALSPEDWAALKAGCAGGTRGGGGETQRR